MHLTAFGTPDNLNVDISFGPFTIRVLQSTLVDSTFSIVSTATLNGALLSHNNIKIQCTNPGANDTATILISGKCRHKTSSFIILLFY